MTLTCGDWVSGGLGKVIVQRHFKNLTENEEGIAFATAAEVREALARPKALLPQAIISYTNVDGRGVEISVP